MYKTVIMKPINRKRVCYNYGSESYTTSTFFSKIELFFEKVSTILQLPIIKQVQHALLKSVVTLATQQISLREGGGCWI